MSKWFLVAVVVTLATWAGTLGVYYGMHDRLPDKVPIHWNAAGQADGFVPREQALPYLLIIPGMMVGFLGLALVLPWLSPKHFEIDRFRQTYFYIMALISAMFAYMHGVTLVAALQVPMDFNKVFVGGMFLFIAALGNVLGKVQRNFWMGVRTPWTLASETVWVRTHRLAAWTFVGGSLAAFVLLMFGVHLLICLGIFGAMAIVPVVYSLVLYKQLERSGRLEKNGSP